MREALQPGHLERRQSVEPEEAKITVADYLLFKLHALGCSAFHTVRGMETSPLPLSSQKTPLLEPLYWDGLQEAAWAGQNAARCQGFGAVVCPESFMPALFEGLVSSSYSLLSILFVVQRSIRLETKELCGLPLSVRERGLKDLRMLMRKYSAACSIIDDRRTAAARIDAAIDASFELLQPVVIDLPDEVALSYIPPHTYRKTVFNYEDQDFIKSCWTTILSRLEQAQSSLFVLGQECWPPLWHHTLLIMGEEFHTDIIASEMLYGHLGSYQPNKFLGYTQLSSLHADLEESYDSLFVFGVPSDCPWLEAVATHHDLLPSGTGQELYILNSNGVSFGDGREFMPPVCLNDFFCHAPLVVGTTCGEQSSAPPQLIPSWHSLVSSIKNQSSPLFVPHDETIIASLIHLPPFAKIFIQPRDADDSWFSVSIASWAKSDPTHVMFAAGNIESLTRGLGRLHRHPIPHNLILLVHASEDPSQEASSLLSGTPLATEDDINEWLTTNSSKSKHPGIIWMAAEGQEA